MRSAPVVAFVRLVFLTNVATSIYIELLTLYQNILGNEITLKKHLL